MRKIISFCAAMMLFMVMSTINVEAQSSSWFKFNGEECTSCGGGCIDGGFSSAPCRIPIPPVNL